MQSSVVDVEKIILVCSSCGEEADAGNTSKKLQGRIKNFAKENNEQCLVLLTSCLGVCPDQGITIAYTSKSGRGVTLEVIPDESSGESVIRKI
ncbi:hypothetical protein DOM22_05445 [Bdellovibrio sp. ZAP7]|nr:hypothetical protein DOM22_05445 [Bdellovibrio sp. ZAP7]